jgi:hypothetical protein
MIPLTPFPLSRVARKNLQSQQTIQILTLRRAFLTASSNRTLDNENHGGNYAAQHLARLQPNCMDAVASKVASSSSR